MKCWGKALVVTLSGVVLSTSARAAAADAEATFPYHGITERNVFNLKDPPPPPTNNTAPPVVIPKITLTLITTIFGDKRAGLKWPVPPTKPGEQAKEESHILSVGQAEAGVEVLDIDEIEGTVKIKNHEQAQTLSFANDGAKLTASASPMGMPPGAQPTPRIPTPQIPVPAGAVANPNPVIRTIPQRNLRLPPTPGQPGQPGQPVQPNQAIAVPNAQAFSMGGGGPIAGPAPPQQPAFTPEQQALIIEAQRKYYQEKGDPIAQILPPTPLTPKPAPTPGQNQPQSP
jgi:hypothetical protein